MKEFFSSTLGKILSAILGVILVVGICTGIYKLYTQSVEASAALKEANAKIAELTKQNGQLAIDLAKAKKDYMEMDSKATTKTVVQYIEKKSPSDADVEVNHKVPKVIVNAGDGKSYDFTPDSKSAQNIVDGKVVLTEDNTLHLDIEKIVDARFKDNVEAINAKHTTEIKEKDAQVADLTKKLKRTRKQRDFYVGAAIIGTGVGMYVGHRF
jgi:chromosome segregation ATPase